MVNGNNKSRAANSIAGSAPASAGVSVPVLQTGNGSNPAGNGGGGSAPSTGTAPGVIPGSGTKAKHTLRAEVTEVVTGIGTQIPDGSTLTVRGTPVPKSQLVAQFASDLALWATVDADVQALKNDRLALKAATPSIRQQLSDVKAALVAHFGKGNPALVAFGFSGKKAKTLDTKQLLAKQVKALGTRKLRGTQGPVAKLKTKATGEVQIQATLSGPASGGIPSFAGAPAPTTGTTPGNGASAGAATTPTPGGNAPAAG